MDTKILAQHLQIGDIVFIHVNFLPFRKIARDTKSWTNHVGIIVDVTDGMPIVAESTFPFSTRTPLSRFIARSKNSRFEIKRLEQALSPVQQEKIAAAASRRMGKFYDTGFNLHSRRQFCSRYVHEVISEALDLELGKVENLKTLFLDNPLADLVFWRLWYLGRIPWQRETITPASLLNSPHLQTVCTALH